MLRRRLLPFLVWLVYRIWTATWRTKVIESPGLEKLKASGSGWICAMWHGDEVAMIRFSRHYKVATMTSTSKDGELMNQVLLRLGMQTSRGSSTRGGAAGLKGLVRLARSGWCPVMTVDGPKGPLHVVKPGIFELARISNLPIVPVGVAASNRKVFEKSWNKAYLPLMFSKVHLVWGEPYQIAREEDPRSDELSRDLKQKLDAVGRMAAESLCN